MLSCGIAMQFSGLAWSFLAAIDTRELMVRLVWLLDMRREYG